MEAKTDAHSPQPTRYLGDLSLSAITMYEPVLFASPISTSELLGPAVLRRTRRCVIRIVRCSCSPAVCAVLPGPLAVVSLLIVLSYRYRLSLPLPIYRNSAGTAFLIVSFPNNNTETFGTISTTNVHILGFFDSVSTISLSTSLAVLV